MTQLLKTPHQTLFRVAVALVVAPVFSLEGAAQQHDDIAPTKTPAQTSSWAWSKVRPVALPTVTDPEWQKPIDRFVAARLARASVSPAPRADRRALLRRATFLLTGLPPEPSAVDAYLGDASDDAFEKVVDRLLASPAYGEHQARHWLDLVRYAESLGHENDYTIPAAWRYRDYVIRAFDHDVPFDQFAREHIAGDLLENPRYDPILGTNESVIGTCFYWFTDQTHSAVDVLRHRADRTDNQIDVLSKTFVGLTVSCARCHDHKFDPISTTDYYGLSGYLRSSRFTLQTLANPEHLAIKLTAITASRAKIIRGLPDILSAQAARLAAEYRAATGNPPAASVSKDRLNAWKKLLAKRQLPTLDSFTFAPSSIEFVDFRNGDSPAAKAWFTTGSLFGADSVTGNPRIERRKKTSRMRFDTRGRSHSATLTGRLEGEITSPNFIIDKRLVLVRAHGRHTRINIIVEGYDVIRNPIYGGLKKYVDAEQSNWFAFDVSRWRGRTAYLQLRDTRAHDLADPSRSGGYAADGYIAIERVVFADKRPRKSSAEPSLPADQWIESALRSFSAESSTADLTLLDWLALHDLLDLSKIAPEFEAFRRIEDQIVAAQTVPGMADGTSEDEHVFERGSPTTLGPIAHRHFLTQLTGEASAHITRGSGRLELSAMIATAENPLTARVYVNRIWHYLFGRGIVPTVDNFGKLGVPPTHPELLDWLTADFTANGWSTKRLIKNLLASRTWQMSSQIDTAAELKDPTNALWHRALVRRLSGEVIRDTLLAITDTLDTKRFGPSVPVFLTPFMDGRGKPKSGPLDGARRRSIYLSVRRNFLSPMFQVFDTPLPISTIGRRSVSNVPAQSLTLLNDPFLHLLAADFVTATKDLTPAATRIHTLYYRTLSRSPTPEELRLGLEFIGTQTGAQATRVWTDYCHVLFNQKEFYFLH